MECHNNRVPEIVESPKVSIGEHEITGSYSIDSCFFESGFTPIERAFEMSGNSVGSIKFMFTGEIYLDGDLCTDDHAVVERMRKIAHHFMTIQGVKEIHD